MAFVWNALQHLGSYRRGVTVERDGLLLLSTVRNRNAFYYDYQNLILHFGIKTLKDYSRALPS